MLNMKVRSTKAKFLIRKKLRRTLSFSAFVLVRLGFFEITSALGH